MKTREPKRRVVDGKPLPWGEVKGVNLRTRRVAIINDWGYAIAEIQTGSVQVRDVVEGNVEALGPSIWTNLSTGEPVNVNITHIQATPAIAALLLATG